MAILKEDIKLLASERLTDFYDGGGSMTGNEVISGELNNLFPDISRLDRTYGRVSLRKCFPAVMTLNQDMYYGSHAIITDPPNDNNVYVTMFTRGDFDDIRQEAQDRIESYVSIAQELLLRPLNDQLIGQRAINLFQAVGGETPKISEVIALKNYSTGFTQYVRITDVSKSTYTFSEDNSIRTVEVVTLDLSAPLQETFPGISATYSTVKADSRVHATVVADSSKYYGVSNLVASITQGARNLKIDSIFNQLVPTSQIETPVIDQLMGGNSLTPVLASSFNSQSASGTATNATPYIYFEAGFMPGTLSVIISGKSFIDKKGELVPLADDGGYSGSVDYEKGVIQIKSVNATFSAAYSVSGTPAAFVGGSYYSRDDEITLANRSYNYVPNLSPLPAPGTVIIDYMAQGNWYTIRDNGRGELVPDLPETGTGTVDYLTGSVLLTLGALPDVGGFIIYHWGAGEYARVVEGPVDPIISSTISHDIAGLRIEPGSLTVTWGANSLTDVSSDGTLSGTGGTGKIDYATGNLTITTTNVPSSDTVFSYSANTVSSATNREEYVAAFTQTDRTVTFTLNNQPLIAGSVSLLLDFEYIKNSYNGVFSYGTKQIRYMDNGFGILYYSNYWGGRYYPGSAIGLINYTTGECQIDSLPQNRYYAMTYVDGKAVYVYAPATTNTVTRVFSEKLATVPTYTPTSSTFTAPNLKVDLTVGDESEDTLVPGSVVFSIGGVTYYDDGAGLIFRSMSRTSGIGTISGTIIYTNGGSVVLTNYPEIVDGTTTILMMAIAGEQAPLKNFVFRTPGTPVRDSSLNVRGVTFGGVGLYASSDDTGAISGTGVSGMIDTIYGIVRVDFTQEVVAGTGLYNCIIYSSLPLDSTLIGIEPIRLPSDGRVPIFKSGDVAVLHHTETEPIGTGPFTDSQQIVLSRNNLSIVDLYDYQGVLVPESLFTVDLVTGTITVVNAASLNALTNGNTENIVANHRIEDMLLISEAQINGYLSSVGPITHDYPAVGAQLSTALIFGDLAGRVVRLFHQATWDGVWRDALSGNSTTAKYDTLNFPFLIQNKGSADQRWAVKFTSSTTVDIIGETLGVVLSGANIANEIAPINPATSTPYFRILNSGWGSGWSTGNNIRFDTTAANFPVWIARTTMQGTVMEPTDNFVMQIRGDAN